MASLQAHGEPVWVAEQAVLKVGQHLFANTVPHLDANTVCVVWEICYKFAIRTFMLFRISELRIYVK